jgi:hypothetical protein
MVRLPAARAEHYNSKIKIISIVLFSSWYGSKQLAVTRVANFTGSASILEPRIESFDAA